MAFYASAVQGNKKVLGVGPFRRHGDALRASEIFRWWAARNTREGKWGDVGFGTARDRTGHAPGRFNDQVGAEVDDDGYVTAVAA